MAPLLPTNPGIFTEKKVNILGQRVLLEILFLNEDKQNNTGDKEVKIISLYKVLTKDANIVTPDETDAALDETSAPPR